MINFAINIPQTIVSSNVFIIGVIVGFALGYAFAVRVSLGWITRRDARKAEKRKKKQRQDLEAFKASLKWNNRTGTYTDGNTHYCPDCLYKERISELDIIPENKSVLPGTAKCILKCNSCSKTIEIRPFDLL